MKIASFAFAGLILSLCARAGAQTISNSIPALPFVADSIEDDEARRILDDPGLSEVDPDEVNEYLEGLPMTMGTGLAELHANPTISWIEAHAIAREQLATPAGAAGPAAVTLRSRESQPLDANAQQGYRTGSYLGTPMGFYNQLRATSHMLALSALEQKQPWEPSFTEHLGGFLMLRYPVPISNAVRIEHAIAGEYALAFGNGLVFGGGIGQSEMRAAASGIEQRAFGIRGTLRNSARSLRGGAMELMAGPAHLLFFASSRAVDANVVNDTIRTIYSTGLHQTQDELSRANAATIRAIGAHIEFAAPDTARLFLKAGASAYELTYDRSFAGTATVPFIGRNLGVLGADVLAIGNKWSASAEAAVSANDTLRRTALSAYAVFAPQKNYSFSMMYSHVPLGFLSPFGEVSGAGTSGIANMDGYYIGVELAPIPGRLKLDAYARLQTEIVPLGDLFGKQKRDYLVSTTVRATNSLDLRATLRDEQDATVASDTSGTGYATVQGETTHLRLEAAYHTRVGSFRTRFEDVRYVLTNVQGGWSASEEVRVPVPAIRSELMGTTTRFQTGSSTAAMWLYESGAPGAATVNPFDGLGWRVALRATVRATHALSCSAYLAGTIYDTPRTLGSGLTAHTGTSDFTAALQLDVRL